MIFTNSAITENIRFSAIESNKFKSSVLTFSLTLPLSAKALTYNILLCGLLRRGSKNHPSMAKLNCSLDELYGSYVEIRSSSVGDNVCFTLSTEILDNKYIPDGVDTLGGVIDIVSDILLRPLVLSESFNDAFFESERKIFLDGIDAEYNNTRTYSIKRCLELLRSESEHPTLEELKKIAQEATLDELRAHYSYMINSAMLDIFYIGATSQSAVREKLAEAFAEYPSASAPVRLNPVCSAPMKDFCKKSEAMKVSQGKLTMGFNTNKCISPDDDSYYAAILLNEIFGGAASSKLFLNVREKMGLCYYCSSSYSIYTGFMLVSSGFEPSRLDVVRTAVLEQLEKIKLGDISDTELLNAKKSLTNTYTQLCDNPFDLQSFYSGRTLFGVKDSINTCIEKLWRVNANDIALAAQATTLNAEFFVDAAEGIFEEDDDDE